MAVCMWKSERNVKKNAEVYRIMLKQETRAHMRKISDILRKSNESLTEDDRLLLAQSEDVIERIKKRTHLKELTKLRHQEIEDGASELQDKCRKLANAIRNAHHLVVYTGAGISTAASIPDYRGPNGVWTMLRQGKLVRTKDLSEAEPTYTHMSITELYRSGYIKQVVSQNCDGLHLRSGLPTSALSELHGNMYIELCKQCRPQRQYVRLCDVTERTAMRKHKTGRRCHRCRAELYDTIVHFGEKGGCQAPYNWKRATHSADSADVILCLGSSLKVLKRYPCLWGMHKPPSQRPRLYIVNLQWTPKDHNATLKINGKCDEVLRLVMDSLALDVPQYTRDLDPIFAMATAFRKNELKTVSKKVLVEPPAYDHDKVNQHVRQSVRTARSRLKCPALEISSTFCDVIYEDVVEDECYEDISSLLNDEIDDTNNGIKVESEDENLTLSESSEPGLISEHGHQAIACDTAHVDPRDRLSLPIIGGPSYQFPAHPFGIPPWLTSELTAPSLTAVNRTLIVPSHRTNDFWWNSIDSQTWMMGLQNYLFLHSLSDLGLCVIGPAPNLMASRMESILPPGLPHFTPLPNYCATPPLLNFAGSCPRLSFAPTPIANITPPKNIKLSSSSQTLFQCHSSSDKPDVMSESHDGVIDLVNFMHSYCIPASRTDSSASQVRCDSSEQMDQDDTLSDFSRMQTVERIVRQSTSTTDDLEQSESGIVPVGASLSRADHSESDTDSAVVFTTGGSSAMSTPSPSSTVTENWFDETSWSPSSQVVEDLASLSSVEQRKIEVTKGQTLSSASQGSPDEELTTPGWFGKGVGLRRQRKRRYQRDSR